MNPERRTFLKSAGLSLAALAVSLRSCFGARVPSEKADKITGNPAVFQAAVDAARGDNGAERLDHEPIHGWLIHNNVFQVCPSATINLPSGSSHCAITGCMFIGSKRGRIMTWLFGKERPHRFLAGGILTVHEHGKTFAVADPVVYMPHCDLGRWTFAGFVDGKLWARRGGEVDRAEIGFFTSTVGIA